MAIDVVAALIYCSETEIGCLFLLPLCKYSAYRKLELFSNFFLWSIIKSSKHRDYFLVSIKNTSGILA